MGFFICEVRTLMINIFGSRSMEVGGDEHGARESWGCDVRAVNIEHKRKLMFALLMACCSLSTTVGFRLDSLWVWRDFVVCCFYCV